MIIRSKEAAAGTELVDTRVSKDWQQRWLRTKKYCCDYQVARSRDQYQAAFRLIYDEYLKLGLTQPNSLGLRILPHQLLKSSWVITATIAQEPQEVVATLSLLEDGKLGLPMDDLYAAEIDRLRDKSKRIGELTCLAHRPHADDTMWNRGKVRATLGTLMRHVTSFAVQRRIDDLVICVHPRHASFYQRRYGFVVLGPQRYCSWAGGQPATPLWLDQRGIHEALRTFDAKSGDPKSNMLQANEHVPVSPAVTAYFWNLMKETSPISQWENHAMRA